MVYLEYELSHVGDLVRAGGALEAVEVVPGENEVTLFPPGEQALSLLPEEALLDSVLHVRPLGLQQTEDTVTA